MATRDKFPGIQAASAAIGVARETLWRALTGHINSPHLVEKYFALAGPGILASLPLVQLPIGTRLILPSHNEADEFAKVLRDCVRCEGDHLSLIAPLSLARLTSSASGHPSQLKPKKSRSRKSKI
jgi:hypothetical protein